MIISVSRRCDIPRFFFDWFLERLDAGFVDVKNPFNANQIRHVSLAPADDDTVFAFWTRDPASILEHAEELESRGCRFYVMCTLTGYPALLEPNMPSSPEVIQLMAALAGKITPDRVIWRYDPVFLSNLTDFEFHRVNFSSLAERLKGVVRRVIVSVYDEYPRAEKRLDLLESTNSLKRMAHYDGAASGKKTLTPMVRGLLADMANIAGSKGMEIQSCAESELSDCKQSTDCLQSEDCGIKPGACIDGEYISKTFGIVAPGKDRFKKRPGCLCCQSVDIGTYGQCKAGCVYCYASS